MSNVSNEEILDMLKIILKKVERLENINTDNVTVSSGTITIKCGDCSSVGIETADDVIVQTIGKSPISIEHAENVSLDSLKVNSKKINSGDI
jgi:hypothetical protein